MTDEEKLVDAQAEISDALTAARALVAALENAECVETMVDFKASLDEAAAELQEVSKEIKALKAQVA